MGVPRKGPPGRNSDETLAGRQGSYWPLDVSRRVVLVYSQPPVSRFSRSAVSPRALPYVYAPSRGNHSSHWRW